MTVLIMGLLSSFSVWSEPLNVVGRWTPTQELQPSHRIETVNQEARSEAGKKKLESLRQSGYACVYIASGVYRCQQTFFEKWVPKESHLKGFMQKYPKFEVVVTPGSPALLSEGDLVSQWQLPVLIYSHSGKTDGVIYWEHSDGRGKLQFKIKGREFWPNVFSENEISFMDFVLERGSNSYTKFYYSFLFQKEGDPNPAR